MRAWAFLLSGMIVWTVHFFGLYVIASVLLTTTAARVLAILLTLACLAADGLLLARALRAPPATDAFDDWSRRITVLLLGISLLAVLWQAFPALLA